jgi:1,2-phenylacetyl-CoA epoxidase catalytic subunit
VFPVDKRVVPMVLYPAADVIPQIIFAVEDVPDELWDSTQDLYELADAIAPYLEKHEARPWDFIWSMERHFSDPYGPLPKARQHFMAGIPDMFVGDPSDTKEERLAGPDAYDLGSELPEEYRVWLEKLMFAHGECMLPYFDARAVGHTGLYEDSDRFMMEHAPDAESRLRADNFFNEELKHTYQFYNLYRQVSPELPCRIFEHEQSVFRAYMDVKMEDTWADKSINNMLSDRFGVYQGFEWVQSSFAPLARLSLKIVKDERGHSNMGYIHTRGFIEREGRAGREHIQQRVHEYWYPFFLAAFGSDDSENNRNWRKWGLKQHTNGELRAAYHAEITQVLQSLEIEAPDMLESLERGVAMAKKARSAATG